MKCELITLEQTTALTILTSSNQVEQLIKVVRDEIESFNGDMSTGVGRKAIISNANKARRTNSALGKVIDDLISQEKASIEKVEQTIKALRESKKALASGLTEVYNNARQMVTDYENELKRIEEEKERKAIQIEIDNAHELALYMDEQFNKELAAKLEQERLAEEERQSEIARLQAEREKQIALEAAERATREAEEKAKRLAEQAEQERLKAIEEAKQAERDRIAAEERAKIQAELAEKKRLSDIEAAKQAEIQRQIDDENARKAEQERLEANKAHAKKIHGEMLQAFIDNGLEHEQAKMAVVALAKKLIPHIGSVVY